jgi:hypothetical protein
LSEYENSGKSSIARRDPGNFVFAELLAFPLYAGFSNDGFADAMNAAESNALNDRRVDYSRTAFVTSRLSGRWSAGVRRVDYKRSINATYYSLVPSFPAFVPPLTTGLPDLIPQPDTVMLESVYEAGGLSAGMEFQAPLAGDRFVIDASIHMALLVGDVSSQYAATNNLYTLNGVVLESPYSELADYTVIGNLVSGTAASVRQETFSIAVATDSSSVTSQVYEITLGARWRAKNYLDVFMGYRSAYYGNVISEIRPANVVVTGTNTINASNTSRIDRSVTYEGFYAGVGFRF